MMGPTVRSLHSHLSPSSAQPPPPPCVTAADDTTLSPTIPPPPPPPHPPPSLHRAPRPRRPSPSAHRRRCLDVKERKPIPPTSSKPEQVLWTLLEWHDVPAPSMAVSSPTKNRCGECLSTCASSAMLVCSRRPPWPTATGIFAVAASATLLDSQSPPRSSIAIAASDGGAMVSASRAVPVAMIAVFSPPIPH
jgi:hypothetical protein